MPGTCPLVLEMRINVFLGDTLVWQPRNEQDEQTNPAEKWCYNFTTEVQKPQEEWSVCHVSKPKQNISLLLFWQWLCLPHWLKWGFASSKWLSFPLHLLLTMSSVFSVFQTDFEKDVDMACRSGEHITGENQQVTWFGDWTRPYFFPLSVLFVCVFVPCMYLCGLSLHSTLAERKQHP